jgi:hypothetical protein
MKNEAREEEQYSVGGKGRNVTCCTTARQVSQYPQAAWKLIFLAVPSNTGFFFLGS